jgi:hypothetical protein
MTNGIQPPIEVEASATVVPASADDIRHKILGQFKAFQPHMQAYSQYANGIAALSIEYHNARLRDVLGVTIEEGVLAIALDARETPKSLDEKLAQLTQIPGLVIKRIIFDRTKATYHLFV